MIVHDVQQRTPEWFALRAGRLTGSRAGDMLATLKSGGEAAARRNLRVQLVCERLTGADQSSDFVNAHMQRGIDLEDEAVAAYEAVSGELVSQVGFVSHDDLMAGGSLDGYLGEFDRVFEVKVPAPATHLEYLRAGQVLPSRYVGQMRHNVWLTEASGGEFVSYCPAFPEPLQIHVVSVEAGDLELDEYEERVREFLAEVEDEVEQVRAMAEAAA